MVDTLLSFVCEARNNKFTSVSSLPENDIIKIWELTSHFIRDHLLQKKGVAIPGLGTFTFCQVKLSIEKDSVTTVQRPVFVISEWFLQTHNLCYSKPCVLGNIPIVPLNYTAISHEGSYSRDMIELCIKEILLAMSRCLFLRRSVQLDFYAVGRLAIKSSTAKMAFFHDFIKKLDCNDELKRNLKFPIFQSVSVMSNPLPSRLSTSCDHLPRIEDNQTPAIQESSVLSSKPVSKTQTGVDPKCQHIPKAVSLISTAQSQASSTGYRARSADNQEVTCPHDTPLRQELCYCCHQRRNRNLYVDMSDYRKTRDIQYEQVLRNYQEKKHNLAKAQEDEVKKKSQFYAKSSSKHNYSVAQDKKALREAQNEEFQPSCILWNDNSSLKQSLERKTYSMQLKSQMKMKQEKLNDIKELEDQMEKKEHDLLAKRLAVLQEEHSKEKAKKKLDYKNTLSEQIQAKSAIKSHSRDEDEKYPVFEIHEDFPRSNKKELNKKFFTDHLDVVRSNQKLALDQITKNKQEEADILMKAKKDLVNELRKSTDDKVMARKNLEKSWKISSANKRKDFLNEKNDDKNPGILLQHQCVKYKRCHQCQRDLKNRGASTLNPHTIMT